VVGRVRPGDADGRGGLGDRDRLRRGGRVVVAVAGEGGADGVLTGAGGRGGRAGAGCAGGRPGRVRVGQGGCEVGLAADAVDRCRRRVSGGVVGLRRRPRDVHRGGRLGDRDRLDLGGRVVVGVTGEGRADGVLTGAGGRGGRAGAGCAGGR